MAHRGAGVSISSDKRNKSTMRRNSPSCQNAHKEAWTGKSSIFTSWEIITPFWMCLWGQRGLCYDACTIYWGRSVQNSLGPSQQGVCLEGHCAFVIAKQVFIFFPLYIMRVRFQFQQSLMKKINSVIHLTDDISVTTELTLQQRCMWLLIIQMIC